MCFARLYRKQSPSHPSDASPLYTKEPLLIIVGCGALDVPRDIHECPLRKLKLNTKKRSSEHETAFPFPIYIFAGEGLCALPQKHTVNFIWKLRKFFDGVESIKNSVNKPITLNYVFAGEWRSVILCIKIIFR